MKNLILVLAALAIPCVAAAAPPLVSGPVTATVQAYVEGTVPGSFTEGTTAVIRNYDNWTNPPSALTGLFLAGSDEIADDLAMTPVTSGWLDNMGLNIANANATGNLTGGTLTVRFYTSGGTFISGFNANLPAISLPAGGSARLSFGAGALKGLNIFLPQNLYVSLQCAAATFSGPGSVANVGYQLRGPNAIGTSTDNLINVTTNTSFNFGGNPVANTGVFIDTDDAATPAHASTWGRVKSLYR